MKIQEYISLITKQFEDDNNLTTIEFNLKIDASGYVSEAGLNSIKFTLHKTYPSRLNIIED